MPNRELTAAHQFNPTMILRQMGISEIPPTETPSTDELSALREEVARLRELVGPSEKSHEDLKRDAIGARDAARKAELETGRLRAQVVELENEVRRWQRDFVWFHDRVVRKIPAIGRIISRFSRK